MINATKYDRKLEKMLLIKKQSIAEDSEKNNKKARTKKILEKYRSLHKIYKTDELLDLILRFVYVHNKSRQNAADKLGITLNQLQALIYTRKYIPTENIAIMCLDMGIDSRDYTNTDKNNKIN